MAYSTRITVNHRNSEANALHAAQRQQLQVWSSLLQRWSGKVCAIIVGVVACSERLLEY
jgi:hypothetical protein